MKKCSFKLCKNIIDRVHYKVRECTDLTITLKLMRVVPLRKRFSKNLYQENVKKSDFYLFTKCFQKNAAKNRKIQNFKNQKNLERHEKSEIVLKVIRKNCCFERLFCQKFKNSENSKICLFVKDKNPVEWLIGVKGELRLKKISFTYDYSPNNLC